MTGIIDVEFISHSGLLKVSSVCCITVRGAGGAIGIMCDHIPLFTEIKPGVVSLIIQGSSNKVYVYTSGGFLKFVNNVCSVQSRDYVDISLLNKDSLSKIKNEALQVINDQSSPENSKSFSNRQLAMCESISSFWSGNI